MRFHRAGVLATGIAALLAVGAAAEPIGTVGAVNPATLGEPPTATARQLQIRDQVVSNEKIIASENGLAQLMFRDQTTLTVGPNSEVVLDRFVYDPDGGAVDVAMTLARGALRFVGGRATKAAEVRIAMPDGVVIGVRGGMTTVDSSAGKTTVVFLAGDYAKIESGEESLTLSRPGAVATIEPGRIGGALSYLGVMDAAGAARLVSRFSSQGDGGAQNASAPQPTSSVMETGGASAPPVTTNGASTRPAAVVQALTDAVSPTSGQSAALTSQSVRFSQGALQPLEP